VGLFFLWDESVMVTVEPEKTCLQELGRLSDYRYVRKIMLAGIRRVLRFPLTWKNGVRGNQASPQVPVNLEKRCSWESEESSGSR
jgi:hypothetical protein